MVFGAPPNSEEEAEEYEVKAQFVERFAGFVRWPTLPSEGSFRFCVLGETPMVEPLSEAARGRRYNDQPAEVLTLEAIDGIDECQLLFLGELEEEVFQGVLGRVAGWPILTVADAPGRAERGVIINLFVADERVGFEANEEAALEAGLELSSRLLRLARIVSSGENGT